MLPHSISGSTWLPRGAGVTELIDLYLSGALDRVHANPANHVAPTITER